MSYCYNTCYFIIRWKLIVLNGIQALDFVISEARRYGVRLILSFVNNYKDYGGRPQYVEWARNAGVDVNGEDDFYTNPTVKEYYKKHVKVCESAYYFS